MAMAREIPGFYYDEEKGKYFRIQQSHRVIPGTGHTQQSVKAAEEAKQDRRRMQEQVKRHHAGKIKRSKTLLNTASPLFSRLGTRVRQNGEEVLRQYGAGLSRCYADACGPTNMRSTGFIGSGFSINRSGMLRATYYKHPDHIDRYCSCTINPRPGIDQGVDLPFDCLANHIHVANNHANLITSVYTAAGDECAVVICNDTSQFHIQPVEANHSHTDYWIMINIPARRLETIWDIAASPVGPSVVVATDTGLTLVDCLDDDNNRISNLGQDLKKKEQMNVCFKESNIVMSGERSGRINFTDIRVDRSVVRLLHSSAVLGTLATQDANQILAHGYSTTSIYDLRWAQNVPVSQRARSINRTSWSTPYLQLAVPCNRWSDHYTRGRKIAYSAELGLIAAASSNTGQNGVSGFVTLYSARTGKVVASPLTRHVYQDDVTQVDIRRVRDGPESIFCLSQNSLDEWSVGRLSCKEFDFYGISQSSTHRSILGTEPTGVSFEQEWSRNSRI